MTPDPLDDARALLRAATALVADAIVTPPNDTGVLGEIAAWRLAWPGPAEGERRVLRPILAVYVAAYATDAQASARARARLEHLAAGGEGLGAMARSLGAGLEVFDLGLERPSAAPDGGEPMRAREAAATLAFGMEALAKSPDVLVLAAAAEGAEAAATDLLTALETNPAADGFALMRRHAGREVAALAGAMIAARQTRTPVILDGRSALAAAAVLRRVAGEAATAHARPASDLAPLAGTVGPGLAGLGALALLKLAGEHAHAVARAAPLPSGRRAAHSEPLNAAQAARS